MVWSNTSLGSIVCLVFLTVGCHQRPTEPVAVPEQSKSASASPANRVKVTFALTQTDDNNQEMPPTDVSLQGVLDESVYTQGFSFSTIVAVDPAKWKAIDQTVTDLGITRYYLTSQGVLATKSGQSAPEGCSSFLLTNISNGLLLGDSKSLAALVTTFPRTIRLSSAGTICTRDRGTLSKVVFNGPLCIASNTKCSSNFGLFLTELGFGTGEGMNLAGFASLRTFFEDFATRAAGWIGRLASASKRAAIKLFRIGPEIDRIDLAAAAEAGKTVGLGNGAKLKFSNLLGEGNFAQVYKAKLIAKDGSETLVAVKIFKRTPQASEEAKAVFSNFDRIEADMNASPQFAKLFPRIGNQAYITELGAGDLKTEYEAMDKSSTLYAETSRLDMIDIGKGIEHASNRHLYLTDMKPDNIVRSLSEDSRVKFIDNDFTVKIEGKGVDPGFDQLASSYGWAPPERASKLVKRLDPADYAAAKAQEGWAGTDLVEANNSYIYASMLLEARGAGHLNIRDLMEIYIGKDIKPELALHYISVLGQRKKVQTFSEWVDSMIVEPKSDFDRLMIQALDINPAKRPSVAALHQAASKETNWILKVDQTKIQKPKLKEVQVESESAREVSEIMRRQMEAQAKQPDRGAIVVDEYSTSPGTSD